MHDRAEQPPIPRLLLRAALGLILFSVVAVVVGQYTQRGLVMMQHTTPVEQVRLMFEDRPGGDTIVREAGTDRVVAVLPADGDGFIRGVLRGLSRHRVVRRLEGEPVYELTLWESGMLTFRDPETDQRIDVNSFGKDNLAAFARLLPSREGK